MSQQAAARYCVGDVAGERGNLVPSELLIDLGAERSWVQIRLPRLIAVRADVASTCRDRPRSMSLMRNEGECQPGAAARLPLMEAADFALD
jgi:hypothetical protein